MYFTKNERKIVENLYNNLSKIKENDVVTLIWDDGTIEAIFDTCFDDFSEKNESDEFISFVFKKINLHNNPPVEISDESYFIINYHNFPKEIILNNEKIN